MRRDRALLETVGSEALVVLVIMRRLSTNSRDEDGVLYGDRLRVLVDSMVFLGVYLLVLFEVLGPLEAFLADLTDVRFEGGVDAKMRCNMVTLSTGSTTVLPVTGQTEVVGRLATDMVVAEMVVEHFWIGKGAITAVPFAPMRHCRRWLVLGVGSVCKWGRGSSRGALEGGDVVVVGHEYVWHG